MRFFLLLVLFTSCTLASVSAQDKVYPNMPFRVYTLNNGFVFGAELQAAAGPAVKNDSISGSFAGITLLAGYQLSRNIVVSAGTGLSYYKRGFLLPLFLDIRYAIKIKRVSPFLYADGGLMFNIDKSEDTKVFINPGIGAQFSISNDLAFTISSGYWLQRGDLKLNSFVNVKAGVKYRF